MAHSASSCAHASYLEKLQLSTKFNIGFYSTCVESQTSSKSHIAITEDLTQEDSGVLQDMTCIDCDDKVCAMRKEHKVWFPEVRNIFCNLEMWSFYFLYVCNIIIIRDQYRYLKSLIQDQKVYSILSDSTLPNVTYICQMQMLNKQRHRKQFPRGRGGVDLLGVAHFDPVFSCYCVRFYKF